jgi:Family of unknown function (DUF6052)
MNQTYEVAELSEPERERLVRVYQDLWILAASNVPSVKAASRAALAHVAQALNGQGIAYELYSGRLEK